MELAANENDQCFELNIEFEDGTKRTLMFTGKYASLKAHPLKPLSLDTYGYVYGRVS